MRPHKLTISGFLSYGTEVEIDFDKLAEAGGLFLIHGKTGAGKTSILDAMSFALFNTLPGARKSLTKSYRSDFAQEATPTFVMFEATFGETRLRIRRSPQYEVAKKSGTGTTTKNPTVTVERWVDGDWETLSSGNQEANAEIMNYVGLTADQFFKLVLLPQGDFAQFLRASSKDRQEILQALFADEVRLYDKVSRRFKELHAQAESDEATTQTVTNNELIAIHTSIENVFRSADDENLVLPNTSTEARGFLTEIDEDIKVAVEAEKIATRTKNAAIANETEVSKAFENSSKVLEAKGNLEKATKALSSWRTKKLKFIPETVKEEKIVAHLNAEILRLDKEITASAGIAEKVTKLKEVRKITISLKKELSQATLEHGKLTKAIATRQMEITKYETAAKGAGQSVAVIGQLEAQILTASIFVKSAKERDGAITKIASIESEIVKLKEAVLKAEQAYEAAELSVDSAQAALLSVRLVPGTPCPVCGSHDHPSPAPHADVISKSDLKKLKAAAVAAKTSHTNQEIELSKPKATLSAALENLGAKKKIEHSKLDAEHADLKSKLKDMNENSANVKDAQEQIELLTEAQKFDNENLPGFAAEVTRLTTEVANSEKSVKELEGGLGIEEGSTPDAFDAVELEKTIQIYRDLIDEFEPLLTGISSAQTAIETLTTDPDAEVPDINQAKADRIAAESELTEAAQWLKELTELKKSLTPKISQLSKAEGKLTKAKELAERMEKLSGHLNGTAGQRIPLVSYYLGHRLDQILVYANHRLIEMSRGQFTLRSNPNKKGAGQNFLSISVFDSWNEGLRDASLFSGGETFAASLALAFGLADVVTNEAGGKSLESLFIDEGFGSLDSEYLNKVMESLEKLRESGRTIGLISHVEEMKQSIPMQLEITKDSVIGASARITELESF